MNLSPRWVAALQAGGWEAVHWSDVGDPTATDRTIMEWADGNGYIVFTHDLDFGVLLATTGATGPSVIQVRAQNVLPDHLAPTVLTALDQFQDRLEAGALITIDEARARVRILPFQTE